MPEAALILGGESFPGVALPPGTLIGSLMVDSDPFERDGVMVQHCMCGCGRRGCVRFGDFDVRFLNDPASQALSACPLQGPQFFPSFPDLAARVRGLGITDQSSYIQALGDGKLPPGSPYDPTEYTAEWQSWSSFLGVQHYHSHAELKDVILALKLHDLRLLPPPDRRRFLVYSEYWESFKAKAKQMGIAEKDIPAKWDAICSAILGERKGPREDGANTPAGGGAGSAGKPKVPDKLSLKEKAQSLLNSVTVWMPTSRELHEEVVNGFFANAWEILDERDTLHGDGFEHVSQLILEPLRGERPDLVETFLQQHRAVSAFRTNGRNWMQAFSIWYAGENRRFINWSAAGLGKTRTVPAIVRRFDIRFTVLFSPKKISNAQNPQLLPEILGEDPTAVLHFSDDWVPAELAEGRHHYFVCNSEKLQLGPKTVEMVKELMKHAPGLVVFDEAHLLVSSNLVEAGNEKADKQFRPRMEGLRYLLQSLGEDTRIVLLTGTPVRVDSREGQALFELIGEPLNNFTPEMSEINALRLRGRLQKHGFQFRNWRLPELRRFLVPFTLPAEVAQQLNNPGMSTLEKEKVRIEHALELVYRLNGKLVINTESVPLTADDATPVAELAAFKEQIGDADLSLLDQKHFPAVRLHYEPLERSVNPIWFSYFIDGPDAIIGSFLEKRGVKYRRCTGDSDDSELAAYLQYKDSSLIASSSWSVGVDGSQRVSNALVMLGLPWHDAGHRQTIARIQRQGAMTPTGEATAVVHEIIPVALNVAYDVKRLNTVYSRKSFTRVLSHSEVEAARNDDHLFTSAVSFFMKQE